ncbi:MAG: hypothetical protein KDB53_03315, partial [Planctomycetes bacterium]|nr:hypothetical protein [Planctomycetota bacterium]
SADLLARVNARVRDGKLIKRGGDVATETLSEGLVREDGLVLYPVYDDIPDLLVEESFELKDL